MFHRRLIVVLLVAGCALATLSTPSAQAQQPTVDQFKQVLNAQLQALKPQGTSVRTVLFQAVRALPQKSGYYPFEVTLNIHDYGPGYPPNHFYGATCVGHMDKWQFDMLKNEAGRWIVQGRMTVTDKPCKDNPAEGVSSMPLAGLTGEPAPTGMPAADAPGAKPTATLYMGEFACYGAGNKLMAGMGFLLKPGNKYTDVDGGRGGTFVFDAAAATITFRGGFFDGQIGRHVKTTGFDLSQTVHCEPWR